MAATRLFITHDLTGAPGALIDAATGNIIAEYDALTAPFLCSDSGASNSDGLLALFTPFDAFTTTLAPKIYQWDGNIAFTQIGTFGLTFPPLTSMNAVGSNFWVFGQSPLDTPANIQPSFFKFNNAGTLVNTVGPLTLGVNRFVGAFCVDDTETVAYYSHQFPSIYNNPIKSWNLLTNTAGPQVSAGVGANTRVIGLYSPPGSTDVIALLQFYDGIGGNSSSIRRYTAAGAIVYSVVFTSIVDMGDDSLETAIDPDLNSCWARWPNAPNYDTFQGSAYTRLAFSNGATLSSISVPVNVDNAPASTCPLLALAPAIPPPPPSNPGSGIYRIVPGKRQDTIFNDDLTSSFTTKIP